MISQNLKKRRVLKIPGNKFHHCSHSQGLTRLLLAISRNDLGLRLTIGLKF
jgi:hypothetical protein